MRSFCTWPKRKSPCLSACSRSACQNDRCGKTKSPKACSRHVILLPCWTLLSFNCNCTPQPHQVFCLVSRHFILFSLKHQQTNEAHGKVTRPSSWLHPCLAQIPPVSNRCTERAYKLHLAQGHVSVQVALDTSKFTMCVSMTDDMTPAQYWT